MTKLQAIRGFLRIVLNETPVIARDKFDGTNYAMDIANPLPRLKLPKDLNAPIDEEDKDFRKDFVNRCPLAQGFSHITLTLLHECGHWATRSVLNIVEYDRMMRNARTSAEYRAIPWEHLATDWAICWLNCPANRKIAKAFERAYFGH